MDNEFEERFLQCFGLGDPDQQTVTKKTVTRTPSQPDPTEREELLKRQAKNSPWLELHVNVNVPQLVEQLNWSEFDSHLSPEIFFLSGLVSGLGCIQMS